MTLSETTPTEPLRIDERLMVLASYLITSVMMTCMAASLAQLGELVQPAWNGNYLVVLGFLVALEALYSHRLLRNRYFTDPKWISYRVSEWVVILIMLKFVQIINSEGVTFMGSLSTWQRNFPENFFNNETVFASASLIIVWLISGRFAGDLEDLEANERVLRQEVESGIYENRTAIRERLANLIIMVGGGMVVFTAIMRVDLTARWFDLPALRAGVFNTIIFFFLGLVLLSLTQFNLLRARWYRDSLPVRKDIAGRWIFYSVAFILVLALVARILPTGYSIGLLSVLNYLFFAILGLLNLIITVLLLPLIWLFALLSSLFMKNETDAPVGSFPTITDLPELPQAEPVPWWELVKSIFFWVVFLGVIGFALVYYLRENRDMFANLQRIPFFSSLARFLNWLGSWLRGVNRQISAAVGAGWQRLRVRREQVGAGRPWRFINPRRLPPRERVRFYYLALVRRSGERGYKRQPAQTPTEYSQSLANSLVSPEMRSLDALEIEREGQLVETGTLADDIEMMTEKFVLARYSQQEISEQEANLVQRAWRHLRRLLGRVRRRKEKL